MVESYSAPDASKDISGIIGATEYKFVVKTITGYIDDSAFSEEYAYTAPVGNPSKPLSLNKDNVASKTEISIVWEAPHDNGGEPISGYEIHYKIQDDKFSVWKKESVGKVNKHTITSLSKDTIY